MAILNFFVAIMLILIGLFAGFLMHFDWEAYFEYKKEMYELALKQKGSEKNE